jgi:hypothetical protein
MDKPINKLREWREQTCSFRPFVLIGHPQNPKLKQTKKGTLARPFQIHSPLRRSKHINISVT